VVRTPHISGLSQLADQYDAFVLDIFGLLHNGVELYSGTQDCLKNLKAAGKKLCLVSNTPRLPENVQDDLEHKGLPRDAYDCVVTAGLSARHDLVNNHDGKSFWFTGKPEFHGFVSNLNLEQVQNPQDADLIVNAISGLTVETDQPVYADLRKALERGKPMLCANPDMVVHIGSDIYLCGGTYAAWYEAQGGTVVYHGKPHPSVYDMALACLGQPAPHKVCALGDALHTDVQGANRMGFDPVWVLGGIHWPELQLSENPKQPDLDLVHETITISPHKPIATLTELRW